MLNKDTVEAIKNNMLSVVIGMGIVGFFSYNIYDEHTQVSELRVLQQQEKIELEREKLEFEKHRNKINEELNNKRNDFILLSGQNDSKDKKLKHLQNDLKLVTQKYNTCTEDYRHYQSYSEQKIDKESAILKLMDKFSNLGVDLTKPNWCDKDYTTRYDKASSILTQISALIGDDRTLMQYKSFISDNKSFISYGSRECRPRVIKGR